MLSRSTTAPSWSRPAPARARPRSWPAASPCCWPRASNLRHIAAVTFTEFAASELLLVRVQRVRGWPGRPAKSRPSFASPCRTVISDEAAPQSRRRGCGDRRYDRARPFTASASASSRPIRSEADIDPGAAVMDRDQADLAFRGAHRRLAAGRAGRRGRRPARRAGSSRSQRNRRAARYRPRPSPPPSRLRPLRAGGPGATRDRVSGGCGGLQRFRIR